MVELYIKLYQFLGTSCFANCCYIVVQAGLEFDINASTTLYSTVAAEAAVEVITEITTEITIELTAEIAMEITTGLGYYLQIWLIIPVVQAQQGLEKIS